MRMIGAGGGVEPKETFNTIADLYDRVRPVFTTEDFQAIAERTGVDPPGPVLEIGPGTGQATLPLLRLGYDVSCVERGQQLALKLREKTAEFKSVRIFLAEFERWNAPEDSSFPLIVSATAFHWIDPAVRYCRCHELGAPGGWLAILYHEYPDQDPTVMDAAHELLREHSPFFDASPPPSHAEKRADRIAEIAASGYYGEPVVLEREWIARRSRAEALAEFRSHSGYQRLDAATRERLDPLLDEAVLSGNDKVVSRHVATVYLAPRLDEPGR